MEAFFIAILPLLIISGAALDLRGCNRPLGLESGAVRDIQLEASSSHDEESTGPRHARVRTETGSGAWCPANQIGPESHEWLQISFPHEVILTAVESQGRYDGGSGKEFTHFYRLKYWRESIGQWASVISEKGHTVFPGNQDTRTAEMTVIGGGIVAQKIRIVPVSNRTITVCMRVELYGCAFKGSLLSYSIPEGAEADGLSLQDQRYDGERLVEGNGNLILMNGLGKLYDGITGNENFERDPSAWVGWRRGEEQDYTDDSWMKSVLETITLNFTFSTHRNLSAILFYTSNLLKFNAQTFPSAQLEFSMNGRDFSRRSVDFRYQSDAYETARWVRIGIKDRLAKVLRVHITLPPFPRWLLLSEVKFESGKAAFTVADEPPVPDHIELSPDSHYTSIFVGSGDPQDSKHLDQPDWEAAYVAAAVALVLIALAAICMVLGCLRITGNRSKSSPSTLNFPSKAIHQFMIEGGTMKHISPSTYEMAKDNMQNAQLERVAREVPPLCILGTLSSSEGEYSSEYADPDISGYCCSDEFTSTMPLLVRSIRPLTAFSPCSGENGRPKVNGSCTGLITNPMLGKSMHYASYDIFDSPSQFKKTENSQRKEEDSLLTKTCYGIYDRLYATTLPEISRSQLKFIEKIGHGEFGEVHLCRLEQRRVAVKVLNASKTRYRELAQDQRKALKPCTRLINPELERSSSTTCRDSGHSPANSSSGVSSFTSSANSAPSTSTLESRSNSPTEAELAFEREMRVLGALRHPNVVEVVGVCTRDRPIACVMEFMENGDVKRYMQQHPEIDAATALSMCTQISAGMSYLESQGFVHRDIAARNCLLDAEKTVKIGDFGMARSLYSEEYYQVHEESTCRLPVRWMPPETLLLNKFSSRSDVWAFAVTMWEILGRCDRLPFSNFSHEQVVHNLRTMYETNTLQVYLEPPSLCPPSLYRELLLPCWSLLPSDRPSFDAIHHYLQSMQHSTMR